MYVAVIVTVDGVADAPTARFTTRFCTPSATSSPGGVHVTTLDATEHGPSAAEFDVTDSVTSVDDDDTVSVGSNETLVSVVGVSATAIDVELPGAVGCGSVVTASVASAAAGPAIRAIAAATIAAVENSSRCRHDPER